MEGLKHLLDGHKGRVFVITDTNVSRLVMTRLISCFPEVARFPRFEIEPGEDNKSMATVKRIWEWLMDHDAARTDLVLNIGGGMVSDTGGFAAATFKRGMPYANVSTTLLGAADASVGGKTGVNFGGVKNGIGAFAMPRLTVVFPDAFSTLPRRETLSGYGEIMKMALIAAPELLPELMDVESALADYGFLGRMAKVSAMKKMEIVDRDPLEKDSRKVLNFGHTFGHALESLMAARGMPLPHGMAVAHGMVVAMILSRMLLGADSVWLYRIAGEIVSPYMKSPVVTCDDYPSLMELMRSDKKNAGDGNLRFVLLHAPGKPEADVTVSPSDLLPALDIYRDLIFR